MTLSSNEVIYQLLENLGIVDPAGRLREDGRSQSSGYVVLIHPTSRTAEAFSFQQAIPPVYQEVYSESGRLNPQLKVQLDSFLATWLKNLVDQGHGFTS